MRRLPEFAKQIAIGRHEQKFLAWTQAGKPVKQSTFADAPTVTSTAELLASPFQVLEAVAA